MYVPQVGGATKGCHSGSCKLALPALQWSLDLAKGRYIKKISIYLGSLIERYPLLYSQVE